MRLALAMLALSATVAAAKPVSGGDGPLELWGAFVATAPASGGSLVSDDAPLLVSGSGYTSHATQSLTIDVAAVPASLDDPHEYTFPPEMSEILRVMALAPARMPVARWHFLAGLELLMG